MFALFSLFLIEAIWMGLHVQWVAFLEGKPGLKEPEYFIIPLRDKNNQVTLQALHPCPNHLVRYPDVHAQNSASRTPGVRE